jgi:pimeloyl-ACP methyl ester carboxylesterase
MKTFILTLFILSSVFVFSQEKIISEMDVLESYPYQINYYDLQIQQEAHRMAYMDIIPEKPSSKTIVLLHGKNFYSSYWETTIEFLVAEGYRVIVPDQIGFGKSTRPNCIQYSFHLLAKNTKSLLDSLSIKEITIMGHSMGGQLAGRFALMYPNMISKLILLDPIGLKDYEKDKNYVSVDEIYMKELKQNYDSIKAYQLKTYYHGVWEKEYEQWARLLGSNYIGYDKEAFALNSAKVFDMINTQSIALELKNISVPVYYLAGEVDLMTPTKKSLLELTASKNNFTIEILPGIGHVPHLEDFNVFKLKVLGFLKE